MIEPPIKYLPLKTMSGFILLYAFYQIWCNGAYKKGGGYPWSDENVWDLSRGGGCTHNFVNI